jgi:hypothetical protein
MAREAEIPIKVGQWRAGQKAYSIEKLQSARFCSLAPGYIQVSPNGDLATNLPDKSLFWYSATLKNGLPFRKGLQCVFILKESGILSVSEFYLYNSDSCF